MRKAILFLSLPVIFLALTTKVFAIDRHVPSEYSTIQAAVNACNNGDVVIVSPGTYTGSGNRDIDFLGKAITVKSENGPENCVIDAEYLGQVFTFYNSEDANSVIDGFTITHGQLYCEPGEPWPISWYGGGIFCSDGSPTIRNCIISDNFAHFGGGIHAGGHNGSSPIIINCILTGNEALVGAAIFAGGDTKIINCTIVGNAAALSWDGSAVELRDDSIIVNSIVWDNYPYQLSWFDSGMAVYNNIQGGWLGTGNIDTDPCFADPCSGDYHLKSQSGRWDPNSQSWVQDDITSPCIDAGDPDSSIGYEVFPNGGRVNMGAYGGTVEASKSHFGGPVCEKNIAGDINGDCIINFVDMAFLSRHWLVDNRD